MRLLTVLLLAAPVLAGDYKPQPGSHAVAVLETLELKGLPLRVTYPKESGKYPVIVFSHGLYGSKDGYQPLARFWAAHGYVCIQPTHPDSLQLGFQTRVQAMRAWEKRPRQVALVLDSLAAIEKKIACRLDADRIGVGGHSFGAHTAQLLGGTTARGKSFADRRVKCVLLLSPQGKGTLFREDSWSTLTKPVLILTGSNDTGRNGQRPEWRLDPYKYSPKGDRYLVWIEGAHHGFGGISGAKWRGAGPRNDEHVRIVRQASLAFFDAFVKGDWKAKAWLRAGKLADRKVRCGNKVPATESTAPADRPSPAR